MRVRNRWPGGAVSVPITVSAVSEKPVTECVFVVGAGLAAAETTEIAVKATRPTNVLNIGHRVDVVLALSGATNCRAAGPD
jgi:hypothetical protein